jgi:hypothetical protein
MADAEDPWDQLWAEAEGLRSAVGRSSAVNVNATGLRDQAQELVQLYFRQVRPGLLDLGIEEQALGVADDAMQSLLHLAQGRNAKASYVRELRRLGGERLQLASARERLIGVASRESPHSVPAMGAAERRIIETLGVMLPAAAKSYEQAIIDLGDEARVSWRGTAVEMREVVREVLDTLAPDEDVMGQPGFKLEKERAAPTMKQKATFVFRSRAVSANSRKAPQDATAIVDELTASFVRSTYERGSVSTHTSPNRSEVEKLKMYVDIVLSELLEASN